MTPTNRPMYVKKFTSARLKEFGYNIENTFEEFLELGEIVALSDSQMLRTIRDVTKHQVNLDKIEQLITLKNYYKKKSVKVDKLNIKLLKRFNEISTKKGLKNKDLLKQFRLKYRTNTSLDEFNRIQSKIYRSCYVSEYVIIVMDEDSHYRYMYENGLYINGERYDRLSCSASQARTSTVIFCKSNIISDVKDRLNNGRNMDKKFSPSKFNAYFGLSSSATKIVSEPKFIVIRDFENKVEFDANFVIENGWNVDDTVKLKHLTDVPMNRTDGMGLISPRLAEQWATELELDYVPSQFCIRQNFIKGMVCVFPIHEFCEEVNGGNYIVDTIYKDEDGEYIKADLREYDLILSESQFKLWDSFKSIDEYIENYRKNNLKWGVAITTPKEANRMLRLNYQFIQTLNLHKRDIEELCSTFIEWLSKVSYQDRYYMLLFLLGVNNTEEKIQRFIKSSNEYWIKALVLNDDIKNDKYIRTKIRKLIKKKIEDGCKGDIYVDGNFQVIVSDPYGFMQHTCGLNVTGLLKEGMSYSNYWNERNIKQVDAMRSPLTYLSEHVVLTLQKDDMTEKWYRYCKLGIILNYHGHETFNFAGSDFDFDILATTSNKVMINGIYKDELPVVYDAPKPNKIHFTNDDLFNTDLFSFGSIIGSITNKSSDGYALLPLIEEKFGIDSQEYRLLKSRLQQCCKAQSAQIDKAKIGREVKGIPKKWIIKNKFKVKKVNNKSFIIKDKHERRKKLYNDLLLNKYPYFFKYVYDDTRRKYNNYSDEYDKTCRQRYGMAFDELKSSKRLTQEQKEFVANFETHCPVIISDSSMNLLCRYIESVNFNISSKIKAEFDFKQFDIYKYKDIEYEEHYKMFEKELKEILYNIRQSKIVELSDDETNLDDCVQAKNDEDILTQLRSKINSIEIIVNCFVDYYYKYNTKANKDTLWNTVGFYMVENIKNNCNVSNVKFPIPKEDGEIRYMGYNYELKEIKINE